MKKMFVESLGKMIAEYSEATESGLFERIRSLQYVKERGEEYVYALYDEATAPLAPSRWPVMDLVELTIRFLAWSPKTW